MKFDYCAENRQDWLSLPMRGAWIEIIELEGGEPLLQSLPMRGAWIEIASASSATNSAKSLPMRGAWIEIRKYAKSGRWGVSLPMRGAWIEILFRRWHDYKVLVAPHAGSVD